MRTAGSIVLFVVVACSTRDDAERERAYVAKEIASLEKALGQRSESRVIVECMALGSSRARMPAETVATIDRLCDVEAPRLLLSNAVADVTAKNAEHPDHADINCMQLLVGDAFKAIARQNVPDPETAKLAAEYTRLCPEQAAKHARP